MKYNNAPNITPIQRPTNLIKDTEVLLKEIKEATNIYTYIENNNKLLTAPTLVELLNQLFQSYSIKKAEFIYRSCFSRSYVYEVFSGKKIPSRDRLLMIILILNASVEEANKLLQSSSYHSLYPKDLRDAILLFGIQQKMSVQRVNDILFELNMELLQ